MRKTARVFHSANFIVSFCRVACEVRPQPFENRIDYPTIYDWQVQLLLGVARTKSRCEHKWLFRNSGEQMNENKEIRKKKRDAMLNRAYTQITVDISSGSKTNTMTSSVSIVDTPPHVDETYAHRTYNTHSIRDSRHALRYCDVFACDVNGPCHATIIVCTYDGIDHTRPFASTNSQLSNVCCGD